MTYSKTLLALAIFQCSVSITLSPVVGCDSLVLFRFPIARELLSYVIHGFRICHLSDGVPSPVTDHVHVSRRIYTRCFSGDCTHARISFSFLRVNESAETNKELCARMKMRAILWRKARRFSLVRSFASISLSFNSIDSLFCNIHNKKRDEYLI